MNPAAFTVTWIGLLVTAGCLEATEPPGRPNGDAQFYASNQSFEHPTAHVKIWVDDDLVFDRPEPVGNEHNWMPFNLTLANGTHELRAHESDTGSDFHGSFVKHGPVWVVVDFWTSPARFTMSVSDHAVAFD